VRAMSLRAELEQARGDRSAAHDWSVAVLELWSGADRSLQSEMRSLHTP
jgi:hypothetical protein